MNVDTHLDPDDPRLEPFRDLPGRAPSSTHFVAETQLAIERLLASDLACEAIVATPGRARALARAAGTTPIYVLEPKVLDAVVGFRMHRGCAALGRRPANSSLAVDPHGPLTLLVLERLADPRNLGAIIRTASTLGCRGVVVDARGSDPFCRRAIRASMGAVFQLPVWVRDDLPGVARELQAQDIRVVASVTDAAAPPAHALAAAPRLALVVGNEGDGVSRALREQCDLTVTIPMRAGADSLAVTAATAILLHQLTAV